MSLKQLLTSATVRTALVRSALNGGTQRQTQVGDALFASVRCSGVLCVVFQRYRMKVRINLMGKLFQKCTNAVERSFRVLG